VKISDLLRQNIKNFKAYSSARDEYSGKEGIFIDANENSIGSVSNTIFNRYPDPHQKDLKKKIAEIKNINADQVFIGNGSDEAIDLLYRAFCEPGKDKVIIMSPTYGMYSVCANLNNIAIIDVPLTLNFQIDLEKVRKELPSAKMIFICSPNNPSANLMNNGDIISILKACNGLVIIDEAYQDFSGKESWLSEIKNFKNLVILQTFSKAWGMAGLRVGMAFADTEIIKVLIAIKYPYNISELVQQTVLKALEYSSAKDKMVEEIIFHREELVKELKKLKCVQKIYPSDANFILVKLHDAKSYYNALIKRKIIVRDRSSLHGCDGCLRITVGTKDENKILIKALREISLEK
jgi:histidinol-phosphate aminotransferase